MTTFEHRVDFLVLHCRDEPDDPVPWQDMCLEINQLEGHVSVSYQWMDGRIRVTYSRTMLFLGLPLATGEASTTRCRAAPADALGVERETLAARTAPTASPYKSISVLPYQTISVPLEEEEEEERRRRRRLASLTLESHRRSACKSSLPPS